MKRALTGKVALVTGVTRKARNLCASPNAVLHVESGAQVVVLERRGRGVDGPDALDAFRVAYNVK